MSLYASDGFVLTETKMRDVMTAAPHTIEESATIAEAHERMRGFRCRHLPVVSHGVLAGIISERDLFLVESLSGAKSDVDLVRDAMNQNVYTTTADAKLRDVARVMAAEKYGLAVVMDEARIVGIFTATDAFRHLVAALH